MITSGRMLLSSGLSAGSMSTLGFFGAGVLHLSAAASVNTLVTAAVAGAAGGFMLCCPVVILRLCMYQFGVLNGEYRLALAALDLLALGIAGPVGAYCLGLAVQPFLIAAAVAVTLYLATNLIRYALNYGRPMNFSAHDHNNLINAFVSEYAIPSGTSSDNVDADPARYITPMLGSYC